MEKQLLSVGIDISMDKFNVCVKLLDGKERIKILGTRSFANNKEGFKELIQWVLKRCKEDCELKFIMEATGSYFEDLAYFLYEKNYFVSVVLPNKIKHFAKSLNVKTKTDKMDSDLIAQVGIERSLEPWKPMSPQYRKLRDLTRELQSVKKEKARALCQLHAMKHSHDKLEKVLKLKEEQILFHEGQIREIESEIKSIVRSDKELKERLKKIEKVKGLRLITILTIICETNGFLLFNSIRQVISYAGMDVRQNESGNFKGKTKISKKGNARIRSILYMPAMSATKYEPNIKNIYERINEKNPGTKQKGMVAGMRKLLMLIFVLWKRNEEYNPNYIWGNKNHDDAKNCWEREITFSEA
jgi:transposase